MILIPLAFSFVLLVVSVALGIVQGNVEFPLVSKQLTPMQLVVLLVVVIRLSVVIFHLALGIFILTGRIVGASVQTLLVFRSVVPCVISTFHAIEGDKLHHGVVREVARLDEIRIEFGGSTVQIAVATDVRKASLYAPMAADEPCSEAQSLLVRTVTTARKVDAEEWFGTDVLGLHVQGSTKSTRTIGRRTSSTLQLHALHTRGKVAHVHPEEGCTLGIVHRNTVGSDVHARGIDATHTQ